MIYDRTQEDIDNAKKIILSKVNSFEELTEDDLLALERGIITQNTINRIEQKQKELYDLFANAGYYAPKIETKLWEEEEDFFKDTDLERIIKNGEILRKAFYDYENTPDEALPKYDFEQLNAMERLLHDLQENYQYMVSHWKKCGIYRCGEVM